MKELDLKKYSWKNIWAGDWNLLDLSDWEEHYLSTLKIGNRPFLDKTVFVIKNGKSSCWVDEDYLKGSCDMLVKIYRNKKEVEVLAYKLKSAVDKAMSMMKSEVTADKKTYLAYSKAIRECYIPHVHTKYLVDGLTDQQRKILLPILQEARVYAEPVFGQTLVFDQEFAKQLSKQVKVKPELLLSLTRDELLEFFDKGKLPGVKTLSDRYKYSVSVADSDKNFRIYTGAQAHQMAKDLVPVVRGSKLTGQSAFPGFVKGRAMVILDPSKPKDFTKGDILITGMTRPEYLPLIKKSGACVTDAGGILSHAAITARELKKPCIIGTKFGTKIFKDGDMVEVDANKGIVRKIK